MTDITEKPKRSASDVAHALVKGAIGAVPVAGSVAAELFSLIVGPPLERRRDRWLEEVAKAFQKLQESVDGLTPREVISKRIFRYARHASRE